MKLSGRAHLANANHGLEAAASVIVAEYLLTVIEPSLSETVDAEWVEALADGLDPEGSDLAELTRLGQEIGA